MLKRCFDVAAALAGLLISSPVLLAVAFAIWRQDRRSPFYIAPRAACRGGSFDMIKFRSMIVDADKAGGSTTAASDPRITPVGHFIRAHKIDEIVQLWNVLRGEMSLVGPRPQTLADAQLYTAAERRMLTVRPGITDVASIVFADEGEILKGSGNAALLYNQVIRPWKSRLALAYIDHQGFWTDLWLIFLTLAGTFWRPAALRSVEKLLQRWKIAPLVIASAARRSPLKAYPPPGSQIQDVPVEDLLGRLPVQAEQDRIRARVKSRVILITGAAGSIGSELCRQIARFQPAAIVGFDISESALFHLEQEIARSFPLIRFCTELGSIQSPRRVAELFDRYRPSMVYHAAAYKHVPMMESHLFEAIENNVFGTLNVALAAGRYGVDDFVMISSDKAVSPTNIMGVSKRIAELLIRSLQNGRVKYVSVRFGNVLGSSGSVVPIFKEQIARGGPITVTHPEMHRYFMTIPEASQLVLQSSTMGKGGEIFMLDMGEPVRILDLAHNLILLSGLRPEEDIRIVFTGLRPGEKLFEELNMLDENMLPTYHEKIKIFTGCTILWATMERQLDRLQDLCNMRDVEGLIHALKELVPDYTPSSELKKRTLSKAMAAEANGRDAT